MDGRVILSYRRLDFLASVIKDSLGDNTLSFEALYRMPGGAAMFKKVTEDPGYYPDEAGKTLIELNRDIFAQFIGPETVIVDCGVGDGNKVGHLLKILAAEGAFAVAPGMLIGIDVVPEYLREARRRLESLLPVTSVLRVVELNYTRQLDGINKFVPPRLINKPKIVLLLGFTIANYTANELRSLFAHLRETLNPGDIIVIDTDNTADELTLRKAYANEATKNFIEEGVNYHLDLMARERIESGQLVLRSRLSKRTKIFETSLINRSSDTIELSHEFGLKPKGEMVCYRKKIMPAGKWQACFRAAGLMSCSDRANIAMLHAFWPRVLRPLDPRPYISNDGKALCDLHFLIVPPAP